MNTRRLRQLPFTRSYWVVPGKLLAGFFPGDRDPTVANSKLTSLFDCGVSHITNLMQEDERDPTRQRPFADYSSAWYTLGQTRSQPVTWDQRPIRDLGIPTVAQMVETLDSLDAVLAEGRTAYVHCWGGKGRTGTVMGCWLARHGEPEPLQILHRLTSHARAHFPVIPETAQQQTFVTNWKRHQ